MYTIEKEFHFSASHQLNDLPEEHQCARLHGHNYILKVRLKAIELDRIGFVLDYGDLNFVKEIVDNLDHRHLNDIYHFNPTSENICYFTWKAIRDYFKSTGFPLEVFSSIAVGLSETPKTWAWYEGGASNDGTR
jgi:6-pyruvoyltetrahydropterin/6-carboxytetrahydropterin synthase